MPTGYTDVVGKGEVTSFSEFALRCARNFGALIEMRDAAMDAEIPDEFKPSTYHLRAKEEAEARLNELQDMSPADVRKAWDDDLEERTAERDRRRERRQNTERRYRAMLADVQAWEPPTPDHEGLKDFMVQQLEESIRFDCTDYGSRDPHPMPDEWHRKEIEKAAKDVRRHEEEYAKDVERTKQRNRWLRDLRNSLPNGGAP